MTPGPLSTLIPPLFRRLQNSRKWLIPGFSERQAHRRRIGLKEGHIYFVFRAIGVINERLGGVPLFVLHLEKEEPRLVTLKQALPDHRPNAFALNPVRHALSREGLYLDLSTRAGVLLPVVN
jgi:hypothetical protein